MLELGQGVGPAHCGKLLAALGADVLKVEPPEGDPLRRGGPFPGDQPHPEKSGLFLHLQAGKRSLVLDPSDLEGRDRLMAGADAVILGGRPADLEAAGLAPADLRRRYAGLVVTSVSTFGLTGPYANYLGDELMAYALGGYMLLTGAPDREPIQSYGHLVEYQAGAHAALGPMAALSAREATGVGQVVDVSAMEAATFLIGGVEQQAYFFGEVPRRNGSRLMGFPPQQPYPSTIRPCRDGFVHCHSNNRNRALLGELIPHPRLRDPELLSAMTGHADEVDAIMDQWLAGRDRTEAVQSAQAMRLPFTEVFTPGEVVESRHHRERGSLVEVEHPVLGTVLLPAPPVRMSATPPETGPAPLLGQHNRQPWATSPPTPSAGDGAAREKPLAGVRVVDFTIAVAGPIAGFILADLGADVIKIEAPGSRPPRPANAAPLAEGAVDLPYNRMPLFNQLNHGKRGISLDVARPEGKDLFLRLVAESDVVVQNFAPRVLPNLGLDYEQLRAANPGVILVSMPAFGLGGHYRDRVSYGPGIDAMSGLAHLTGYPDGPPMKPGNFFCDQQAGTLAAFATCAALWHRRATGEGQHLELAMIEGEFQLLADAYLDYAWNGRDRLRAGNDHPRFAPHDAYRCRGEDAWVAIAVEDDQQWRALCQAIGSEVLAADARYSTQAERHAHRADLRPVIEAWTTRRGHYEAQATLQAAGVPAAAAINALELLSDPHVAARRGFEYTDRPGVGPAPNPRVAFTLSQTPVPISRPAPAFAQDNEAVYCGLLGLSREELQRLTQAGVTPDVPVGGH